jgi:hypothetical protein
MGARLHPPLLSAEKNDERALCKTNLYEQAVVNRAKGSIAGSVQTSIRHHPPMAACHFTSCVPAAFPSHAVALPQFVLRRPAF